MRSVMLQINEYDDDDDDEDVDDKWDISIISAECGVAITSSHWVTHRRLAISDQLWPH